MDRASESGAARVGTLADMLLDGLIAGMIGAVIVALWFLVLDAIAGRPFYTPALLGGVLLHGSTSISQEVIIAPLEIAAYTAFHFVAFILVGLLFSYLMTLFERFPIMFFVLLVLFLCLQIGFFFLDLVLGAQLLGKLKAWTVVIANLLASAGMAFYLWRRHPSVLKSVERLWEEQ